jgi:hypothetical protein
MQRLGERQETHKNKDLEKIYGKYQLGNPET